MNCLRLEFAIPFSARGKQCIRGNQRGIGQPLKIRVDRILLIDYSGK